MKAKIAAVVLLGLIACVGLGIFLLGARKPKEKTWHFVRSEISLGSLTKNQAVPVTFEIRNDQDVPLKIASTDVSCRCTTLVSAPDEVPPHRSAFFRWSFSGSRSSGSVKDSITVTGGDGRTLVGTFDAFVAETSTPAP